MNIKFNYDDTFSTVISKDKFSPDIISRDNTISTIKSKESPNTLLKVDPTKSNTVNTDSVISTSNKNIVVNIEPRDESYIVDHTREFYRGRSFRYAGVWTEGVHYICDDYIVDFVSKDDTLLVCTKSHMSSSENEPVNWVVSGGEKFGILSDYWDLVLSGTPGESGGVYLPSYDEENDRLMWTLVPPEGLDSPIYVALGLNNRISSALEPIRSDISGIYTNISDLEITTSHLSNKVSDLDGNVGQLWLTAEEFGVRMENAEGEIGELSLTAHQFTVQMSNLQGDVGKLWLTAEEFGVRMSNAEGDISQLTQTADEIQTRVENAEGDISQIHQRADEIWSQVENNAGDISRISQRADEIQSQVSNNAGDISRISQRADEISSQVENALGDVSRIEQRADSIESTVQNIEGDISQIRQTADEISSRVENAEGDISQISQKADEISSQVENTQGDISLIQQRADEITSRVENAEGSISEIRQTAEEISSTVEQNKILADGAIAENRSLISQTAEEIRSEVESNITRLDGSIEEARSEIRQTAEEITSTVERNKIDVDGSIEELNSRITQTAEEITSTVERNKIETDGAIESARSEIRQTADEISSTVERNKQEIDGSIEELRSNITQTAEEIRSEVSRVEQDLTGNIESAKSEFKQTADEIATTVEQNKLNVDGDLEELRSNISQTAESIIATVEANKQSTDGAIENLSSEIRQTAEEISSTVQANKTEIDGSIEQLNSRITQTAEEITSTVEANKQSTDGQIEQLSSNITQTASEIRSEVASSIEDINGNIEDAKSEINQLSDEIDLKVSQSEFDTKTGSINQSISDILIDTAGIHESVSALSGDLDNTASAFNNYVINTNGLLETLQKQVDGAIETWYYNGTPTLNNFPASEWTTDDDKDIHIGDLYYDKDTEYAYRFMENNGVYSWEQISDSDIATALQNASRAQATADGKMKVFVTTPTPPYQVGDLWVQGSTNNKDGMIYKCIVPKVAGQTYSSSDWAIAFDAVTTKVIKSSFDIFADAIQGKVWQEDPNGIISGNTYSLVKQTVDNINLSVASVRNDLLATGIDISGVQYDDQGHVIQGGTVTITGDNFILQGNQPNSNRALTLVYDTNGVPRISASNLEIEGIFSTAPGSVWLTQKNDIKSYADDVAQDAQTAAEQNAQGFADTAEQNAKDAAQGYADAAQAAAESTAQGYANAAERNAKSYTDTRETIIKAYADSVGSNSVTSAENYFNNIVYGEGGSASSPATGSILDLINGLDNDYTSIYNQINTGDNSIVSQINSLTGHLTDLGYLTEALWDGDTVTAGGLILSSLIQLGSKHSGNTDTEIDDTIDDNTWRVWSGLNGVYDSTAEGGGIAAWYGGAMLDRYYSGNTDANRAAKSLFRFDGSGYLAKKNIAWEADGSGYVANNKIAWDTSGNLTVDGYVLTNEMQLKDSNSNIKAGISGAYNASAIGNGIASWWGGEKLEKSVWDSSSASYKAAHEYARSLFRMDGSGYLANNNISWDAAGNLDVNGFVLTNEIQLKDSNGNVKAGISGRYNSSSRGGGLATWYGGPKVDHIDSPSTTPYALTGFRFDGTGYLADGKIRWDYDQSVLKLIIDGYILTNEIQLQDGNGNIQAGMSGAYDNSATHFGHGIASWYGGPKVDHEKDPTATDYAKSVFRMDGSGYLAGGQISWGDTGSVVIHGATLQGDNGSISTGQLVERILEIGSWFIKQEYIDSEGHTRYYLRLVCGDTTNIAGFVSDGFVSAGGLSTTEGGGGGSASFLDYATIKTLSSDVEFATASAWATHLFYQDVFGSGSTTIASRITALENSSTNVTYTASQASGTLLGTITIDGNANRIYAPTIPSSLKNPYSLKFGTNSYDGSSEKTIKAEDLSACVMGTVVGTVTITT